MTIEYLKCRADLNFEVDFGVNGAIGAIVTKWDPICFILLLQYMSCYNTISLQSANVILCDFDILLHHITYDSPTYDLITWIKMFVFDNKLGLKCVFVFNLTIQGIKYRGP